MNEAALRARSLTLADGQVVVPIEDVLDLAAPSLPLNEHGRVMCVCGRSVLPENWPNHLQTVSYGREHRLAATPSGGPLDAIRDLTTHLREAHDCDHNVPGAAEYARLTEDAG